MKKYVISHNQEFILRIVLSVIGVLFVCLFSYSTSNRFLVIVILTSLIIYKRNYVDGNSVEEYCLPFITVSLYYQMRFFYNKFKEHSPYIAVFYGITFGVCAMTRITNGIIICTGAFVIVIMLLFNKEYLNLGRNTLGFIFGFVVVCVPFAVYFLHHDCFVDFIYGTFTFNFEYANRMESWIKCFDFSSMVTFFKFYFSHWCIAIAAVFALWRKAYNIALFYFLTFILETYLFMSGQLFIQYPGICMPQVVLLFNELYPFRLRNTVKEIVKLMILPVIIIICAYSIKSMAYSLDIYHVYHDYVGTRGNYEYLLTQIPEDEIDSFVAYGDNRFKELYLAYDLMPSYKYFVVQEWHASFSDYIKNDIYSIFENGNAKWIITAGETENISDILNEHYELYDSIDDYMLYRLG